MSSGQNVRCMSIPPPPTPKDELHPHPRLVFDFVGCDSTWILNTPQTLYQRGKVCVLKEGEDDAWTRLYSVGGFILLLLLFSFSIFHSATFLCAQLCFFLILPAPMFLFDTSLLPQVIVLCLSGVVIAVGVCVCMCVCMGVCVCVCGWGWVSLDRSFVKGNS